MMYVFITLDILVDIGQFIDFILICLSLVINDKKKQTPEIHFKKNRRVNFNASSGHKEPKTWGIFWGKGQVLPSHFRIYYRTRVMKTEWYCGVSMSQNSVFRGRLISPIDFC